VIATRITSLAALVFICGSQLASAQQSVTVSVPPSVSFSVSDVGSPTHGTPATTQVTYSTAIGFTTAQKLNISVQPMAATFAGPSTGIAASKVSWTASASSGNPSNGTLAFGSYTNVYRSPNKQLPTSSGTITLAWTMGALPASGLRSGTYTLTVRWKFEAL
jgi:hypothetical protein